MGCSSIKYKGCYSGSERFVLFVKLGNRYGTGVEYFWQSVRKFEAQVRGSTTGQLLAPSGLTSDSIWDAGQGFD